MTKTLALALAAAFVAAPALAQTVVTDADGDGLYSMEELVAAYPDLDEATFAAIDQDGSGAVDADELQAAKENAVLPD